MYTVSCFGIGPTAADSPEVGTITRPNGLASANYPTRHCNSLAARKHCTRAGKGTEVDEGGCKERFVADFGDARRCHSRALE